jgi:3-oxoacyl-(acyl-carrier-protein) synthase
MTREPVVITGAGIVNACLTGTSAALHGWLAGPSVSVPVSAEEGLARTMTIPSAATASLIDPNEARRMSRVSQLTVASARLALGEARLADGTALGIVLGTEFGDLRSTIEFADGYLARGPAGLSALLFPNTVMNTMAAAASIAVGAREGVLTLNAPLVAGELAVARAASAVASGRMAAVLAGGVDQLDDNVHRWFVESGGVADVRGEGAALLLLESASAAAARGVRPLGEIAGWAWDTVPAPPCRVGRSTASRAIRSACTAAALDAADITAVYGSASGDAGRDRWEADVLARALGRSVASVSLSHTVGHHAGLGALRVAAAAWTARTGLVARDPDGDGPGRVRRGPVLVHGLARGGTHVALVVVAR